MPFITLNNNFSNLASYYNASANNGSFGNVNNVTHTQKPQIPKESNQYTTSDSGLIRGGFINTALSIKNDFNRVNDFLYRSEKGNTFILKQIGLRLSNPLLEQEATQVTKQDATGALVSTYQKTNRIGATRIYNGGINTLASISGTALGFHFPAFGFTPASDYNYAKIAKTNNNNSEVEADNVNPLPSTLKPLPANTSNSLGEVIVTSTKKSAKIPSPLTNKPNRLISYLGKLTENGTSTNPVILQSYFGGSESVYGIGTTLIKTTGDNVTNRTGDLSYRKINEIGNMLKPTGDSNSHVGYYYGATEAEELKLNEKTNKEEKTTVINKGKAYIPLEYTYGVSHAGKRVAGVIENSVDSINAITITDSSTFYNNITNKLSSLPSDAKFYDNKDGINQSSIFGKDIIKFRIEILNNNIISKAGQINTEVYAFRAYINELSDGIDAKWDSYRYMGRGEEFFIYNGFTRDISIGFTVFAHSKSEMKPLYTKINNLMSSFTPDYSAAGLMRGNVGYLTVGDYLYRVPGVFTSMKITNLLETHWETNLEGDIYELPKLMNINLSFKPIHSFVPRRNYANAEKAAFITPDVNSYNDKGISTTEIEGKLSNKFMPNISQTAPKETKENTTSNSPGTQQSAQPSTPAAAPGTLAPNMNMLS
jgi:hypothetical protein